MGKRWIGLGLAALMVLACGSSFAATSIELQQSDGTKSVLGGVGSSANVNVVSGEGVSVGGCMPTAAIPEYVEGVVNSSSCDLNGNTRVTIPLLSGEDQTSQLLATSGGSVRIKQILGTGGIPSTATDATSATSILPVGRKTFQGIVTCTGTCVQTQKIYGTWLNVAVVASSALVCTLTISASTTASDWCDTDRNFSYWFVVTTLTSGTTPLAGLFVMY